MPRSPHGGDPPGRPYTELRGPPWVGARPWSPGYADVRCLLLGGRGDPPGRPYTELRGPPWVGVRPWSPGYADVRCLLLG